MSYPFKPQKRSSTKKERLEIIKKSCSVGESLNGAMQLDTKVGDVTTKLEPSVQRSPSVASC